MTFNTSPGIVVSRGVRGIGPTRVVPAGYYDGLKLWRTGLRTVTVEPGRARSEGNIRDLVVLAATLVDISAVGLNGRDQVAIFFSDILTYAYLVGGDGQPTGVLVSQSPIAPTLLPNYTDFVYIGVIPIVDNEGPAVLEFTQTGSGKTRRFVYGPGAFPFDEGGLEVLVGGLSAAGGGSSIAATTGSASWRNIVTGGVDVNFNPLLRIPSRPLAAGGLNTERRGIDVIWRIHTRTDDDEFLEIAPAVGNLEAPTTSPSNGTGIRIWSGGTISLGVDVIAPVGEGQSIQYRTSNGDPNYAIEIRGFLDELGAVA